MARMNPVLAMILLVAATPAVAAAAAPQVSKPTVAAPSPTASAAAADEARLATEAKALAKAALQRYGTGYTSRIDPVHHIVYVSAIDTYTLGRVAGLLGAYADQERQILFHQPLPWNVTVVLPTLADYRKPEAASAAPGHYDLAIRTLESLSLSDILMHEFTHALHHADQAMANQHHPVWLLEGLACLFQRSTLREGKIEVLVGRDLGALQEAVRSQKAPSWKTLVAMDAQTFLKDADVCYAESHYIMLYLHQHEKLQAFYETYKAGYAGDAAGGAALAKTLGKPLQECEADWRAWVLEQKAPWAPVQPTRPHLGIKMEATAEGVKVDGLVRGSAAERMGQLKVGDIILSVADQATPAPRDLTAAVQACQAGETVDVEVIRDGRRLVVKQLLGAAAP